MVTKKRKDYLGYGTGRGTVAVAGKQEFQVGTELATCMYEL